MGPEPDGDPSDTDELDELFGERGRGTRGRGAPKGARSRLGKRPVERWRSADERDDELDGRPDAPRDGGKRVYWRARDSLWFEPLVALAIIVVLLVSLFAYTSNWPPVYVVESNSMQHGTGDHPGFLNAGDVVLAQKLSPANVVTYFPAVANGGPSNYGEPGDVLLYYPDGATSATPVVHRAILFLQASSAGTNYSAPGLAGLPCSSGSHPYYRTNGTPNNCGTTNLTGQLDLYNIGWKHLTLVIQFSSCLADLGRRSGYLTLGDNNSFADQVPGFGCSGAKISSLVQPAWIIGAARGLLPWFGALKLFLDGNAQLVPGASWEYLGLSLAGIVLAAAGVHFLLRRLGVRSKIRRREEERQERDALRDDEFADDDIAPRPVRSWKERPPEPPAAEPPPARTSMDERRRSHVSFRPRPRRPHPAPRPADDEDEPADDL